MSTHKSLPYDAEHLTKTEREADKLMHSDCWSCWKMRRRRRSGAWYCIDGLDVRDVIEGKAVCNNFYCLTKRRPK